MLVEVGVRNRNSLSLKLGVEQNELALVAFNGARMSSNLGCVLVVTTSSLMVCPARMRAASAAMAAMHVSICWLCIVCGVVLDD